MAPVNIRPGSFSPHPDPAPDATSPSTSARVWSEYQSAVFDFVTSATGSAQVVAVAGSGKTTTIVEAARRLMDSPAARSSYFSVSFLAFNKSIAEELKSRLPAGVRAQTLNAMGYGAWRRHLGDSATALQLDSAKTRQLVQSIIPPHHLGDYSKGMVRLIGLAKAAGLVPCAGPHWVELPDVARSPLLPASPDHYTGLVRDTDEWWLDTVDAFGLDIEADLEENDAARRQFLTYARTILVRSILLGHRLIDFDDQLYLPVICQARFWQNDVMFVDEAQDLNQIQRVMIRRALKRTGRLIAVGDPCQPSGTAVTMADGSTRPIQQLQVGDLVRTVAKDDGTFPRRGRRVLGITKRQFTGTITEVRAGKTVSRYTPNHYCYVKMSGLRGKYVVYLMGKMVAGEMRYRVGSCGFHSSGPCGPMMRMRLERADAVWVLDVFDTRRDAVLYEYQLSYRFALPMVTFHPVGGGSQINAVWLLRFWSDVHNRGKAMDCLDEHGRDSAFPINELASRPGEFWVTRPTRMRACNIIAGMQVLVDSGRVHYGSGDWAACAVKHHSFSGPVWSLDVERDHSYVADGIATFNCQAIYSFRGASSDSMAQIARDFGTSPLPLTVTYRCPKAVVHEAHKWVTHITAHDSAPEGTVRSVGQFTSTLFAPTDAIICRNTRPLIDLAFNLLRDGVPCKVRGRDIGQGLVALIKRFKTPNLDTFADRLHAYVERKCNKWLAEGKDELADRLTDQADTIHVFLDQMPEGATVEDLVTKIGSMFSDNGPEILLLSTIHRAKGLEFPRVFILDPDLMPSKYARTPEAKQQESNLQYVAVTRAKSELVYLQSGNFKPKAEVRQ